MKPAAFHGLLCRSLTPVACFAIALLFSCVALAQSAAAQAARRGNADLLIYTIDVEGGQSTLLVSPSGGSTAGGYRLAGDNNGRDAERIQAAMKDAGITKIDKVLITHFHVDHVGGVPNLVERVKVGEFLDHGVNREDSDITRHDYAAYVKAIGNTPRRTRASRRHHRHSRPQHHRCSRPTANTSQPVPGIKPVPNPYCASEPKWELDATENPRSAGILVRFGKFRFLDLGDLTKAKEIPLVCPDNLIGHVDLYLVNHHGINLSNSKAFVDAIHPRVAIMDNGAHKAGSPKRGRPCMRVPAWRTCTCCTPPKIRTPRTTAPRPLIANPKGDSDGHTSRWSRADDGSFSVTNSRTGQTKEYPVQ